MNNAVTFVLVGHCGPDCALLRSAIRRAAPGANVVEADDESGLRPHIHTRSILLVNRQLSTDFSTESGVELIRHVLARDNPPIAMLVSNLPEAQAEAAREGAAPGFGKSQLYDSKTIQMLRDVATGVSESANNRPQ